MPPDARHRTHHRAALARAPARRAAAVPQGQPPALRPPAGRPAFDRLLGAMLALGTLLCLAGGLLLCLTGVSGPPQGAVPAPQAPTAGDTAPVLALQAAED